MKPAVPPPETPAPHAHGDAIPRPTTAMAPMQQTPEAGQAGHLRDALRGYRRAIAVAPEDVAALYAAAETCLLLNDHRQAATYAHWGRAVTPTDYRLALLTARLQLIERRLGPADPEFHSITGFLCQAEGDTTGMAAAFTRLLVLQPDNWRGHLYRGVAHQELGRLDDAILGHRRAALLQPANPVITSNIIVLRDVDPRAAMADLAAERRAWQARHGAAITPWHTHGNDRDPDRRLRIGYVSSYFHESSGAQIALAVMANHNPAVCEAVCYATAAAGDIVTRRLQAASSRWVDATAFSDDGLAERIRQDAVDILVDIDGHSPRNRLPVFARKPAPVQVTGWGHAGGTGLAAMDYAFVDSIFAPPADQAFFAERLIALPCVLTVDPPRDAPPVEPPPAAWTGRITFGCLNRLMKVSPDVLAVWARLLAAVPTSRLLLKGRALDDPGLRDRLALRLGRLGVAADRLILMGGTSRADHLAAHAAIDIALDPFPLGGGVATAEALWMGVPVVSFAGPTMYGRVAASILTAIGAPELVAKDIDGYLGIARALAADLSALTAYRHRLRDAVASSPVGNPGLYSAVVEQAYRAIWRHWCQGG